MRSLLKLSALVAILSQFGLAQVSFGQELNFDPSAVGSVGSPDDAFKEDRREAMEAYATLIETALNQYEHACDQMSPNGVLCREERAYAGIQLSIQLGDWYDQLNARGALI